MSSRPMQDGNLGRNMISGSEDSCVKWLKRTCRDILLASPSAMGCSIAENCLLCCPAQAGNMTCSMMFEDIWLTFMWHASNHHALSHALHQAASRSQGQLNIGPLHLLSPAALQHDASALNAEPNPDCFPFSLSHASWKATVFTQLTQLLQRSELLEGPFTNRPACYCPA